MDKVTAKYETFEYDKDRCFHIYPAMTDMDMNLLSNHWHDELEIIYTLIGGSRYYINGECIEGYPGRLIVTNSGFIHNIIPASKKESEMKLAGIVIIISKQFLQENFPEYTTIYFTNKRVRASREIDRIAMQLLQFVDFTKSDKYEQLCAKGLVLELLYYMCKEGLEKRQQVDDINVLKDIERMKGVISFIEENYAEHLTQAFVAKKFYFSTVYFSKYFKKCTGLTFTDYLMHFRVQKAKEALLQTNKSVSDIASECGFADDRRLIISFKKIYEVTPLQYRKKSRAEKKEIITAD